MNPIIPIVERAFQIARGGGYADTKEVRKALAREGYTAVDLMHITSAMAKQIRAACKESQGR